MANFELQFELGTKCFKFYQEILRLTKNDRGYCFKKNERFCDEYNVSERTIQRWLKRLTDLGLIKVELIKNKYRRIYATQMSSECRPNVGVNNELLTNKSLREKKQDEEVIETLKETHGEELVEEALTIANKKAKWNTLSYLQTILENGFKPKASKSTFKRTKKRIIREELVTSGHFKRDQNGLLTGVYGHELNQTQLADTRSDEEKVAYMKQLQAQLLGL